MLHAFGCSFTYGSSCRDPSTDAWPQVLAKLLGTTCANWGEPSASNDRIWCTVAEQLHTVRTGDRVVVMMTFQSRRYFRGRHVTPAAGHACDDAFYRWVHDDCGDSINFTQNLNALHNVLRDHRYTITFTDARPLLEAHKFGLARVADVKHPSVYIPRGLSFNRYIEPVDGMHPSTQGHTGIAHELWKGTQGEN